MPIQSIAGKSIHYLERGRGTPVVLLHGFPLDSRVWDGQVAGLAERFRVITPDLTGFGQSKSNAPFTIASLADDVHALLSRLGALPCVLGGLSMGGYVSLAFVKKYPRELRGLMLIDTKSDADTSEGKQKRNAMIELARKAGSKLIAEQMFPNMIAKEHQSDVRIAGKLRRIMEDCPRMTIEHACAAMRDREDYTPLLPSIAVPTLVMVGEYDAITSKGLAEGMQQAIPGSRLAVIEDAGHMSPLEKPDDVTAAIVAFAVDL